MKPVISLVGKPNVGKSTLFNVLTRSRDALVADFPGLTRDRKYGHAEHDGYSFIVIDTGGLSGEKEELADRMASQTLQAIHESTVVLFMVDARDGLTVVDENIATQLRRLNKKIYLVVNKIDGVNENIGTGDFFALGYGDPLTISATNNRGIKKLLTNIISEPDEHEEETIKDNQGIKVAFVGRPNVGKSTLVNKFLGEDRVVVLDMPGTTRDSIYIPFEHNDQRYTLIDTAGVRRKKSVHGKVEIFSIIKTMQSIEEANVIVMMIDARKEIADQDLHLLGFIIDAGKALILAINKWDGLDDYQKNKIKDEVDYKLQFIDFTETFYISALHGSNVGLLYDAIKRAYTSATCDISTSKLTAILEEAIESHQPPLVRGRRIKLRYAHQGGMNPPRIIIHGNQTALVPATYQRYLSNYFLKAIRLVGTPVKIEFKTGNNPFAGKRNTLTKSQLDKRKRMIRHIKIKEKKAKSRK